MSDFHITDICSSDRCPCQVYDRLRSDYGFKSASLLLNRHALTSLSQIMGIHKSASHFQILRSMVDLLVRVRVNNRYPILKSMSDFHITDICSSDRCPFFKFSNLWPCLSFSNRRQCFIVKYMIGSDQITDSNRRHSS
jgi:hypothetical protein